MASHPAVAALRRSHTALRAVVEPLSSDQLGAQSYADEWTIAQVLSHLGSGAVIGGLTLDAALANAPAPEFAQFQAVWDEWNAKDPQSQAVDALTADEKLTAAWEAVPDERLGELSFALGPMQLDGVGMARMRLAEHALHTWDVAVALDPTATVEADAADQLLDVLTTVVGFSGKPAGEPRDVVVATTDPERRLVVSIGEALSLRPAILGDPEPTVTLPAEAFVRLVYGRLDVDHTPAGAESPQLAELRAMLPGF